jgi:K+-transporting ATPase ATPase A chain
MNWQGWAEIVFTIGISVALSWPLGAYMARVWQGERTWLTPILKPVERAFYVVAGVDPEKGQGWLAYTLSVLAFSLAGFVALYAILRVQHQLPLDPQGFSGMSPDLAFNTAISFVTNTNWQFYGGETTLGHMAQMAGLTVQNFMSAAVGVAIAAALARAFAANRGETVGNFWADLTRITLYIFLPISIVFAVALVALGVPQTLMAHVDAHTMEGARQTIALGPVAGQEAIKQLGTNGGGFFNANSAHPFENPSSLTNILETIAPLMVSFACFFAFGRVAGAKREAGALVAAAALIVFTGTAGIYFAETQPVPAQAQARVSTAVNMEGKEVRFDAANMAVPPPCSPRRPRRCPTAPSTPCTRASRRWAAAWPCS